MKTPAELMAGRRRIEPQRDSRAYARLMSLGSWQMADKRPLIKPTPANLRGFGRTVYARRAINRIKDPIAGLHWEIAPKAGVKLNATLQKQIDVAKACFASPNHDDSARTLLEQLVEDLMHNGAGTYEQQVGADEMRPLWMWPVDSLSIQINAGWEGKASEPRYYQQCGFGNVGGVNGIPMRNDELVYIRLNPTTAHPFGLGPLEVAFTTISRKLGAAEYAGKTASNAQPENLLVFPGMDPTTLNTLRGWWRNEIEGQGQTPIMGPPAAAGSKAEVLKLRGTEDKALFLGWQEFLIREIATAFSISAMSLNVHGDVNRSIAEVIDDMDWDNAVVPTASLIASYITRETIEGVLGYSQLEFRFLGLKRDDKKAEAEIYTLEYTSNALLPDEYRARNNLPPLDNQWGQMTYADAQIAIAAARGAAAITDPALPAPKPAAKPAGKK